MRPTVRCVACRFCRRRFVTDLRIFSTAKCLSEYGQGQGLDKKAKKFNLESTAELLLPPLTSMAYVRIAKSRLGDLVTIESERLPV
jgi:hypothetical protein